MFSDPLLLQGAEVCDPLQKMCIVLRSPERIFKPVDQPKRRDSLWRQDEAMRLEERFLILCWRISLSGHLLLINELMSAYLVASPCQWSAFQISSSETPQLRRILNIFLLMILCKLFCIVYFSPVVGFLTKTWLPLPCFVSTMRLSFLQARIHCFWVMSARLLLDICPLFDLYCLASSLEHRMIAKMCGNFEVGENRVLNGGVNVRWKA